MLRSARRPQVERRVVPRVPLAVPIRYATEEGHVGIGVLVDISERGAGLLVPNIEFDVERVWIQFVWFDDRVGLQGRVAYVHETPDGRHVGMRLEHLHPDSVRFLANLVIPYARSKLIHDRKTTWRMLSPRALWGSYRQARPGRRRPLPAQIECAGRRIWAITEDASERGAVLLLPQGLPVGAAAELTPWGAQEPLKAEVARSEPLELHPIVVYRVVVLHVL
jgi:hypothetical protein